MILKKIKIKFSVDKHFFVKIMKLFQNLFKSNRVADIGDNVLVSEHNHVNISLTIMCQKNTASTL